MYCPNCSQEQISKETRFCSRCGFLMTGVVKLLENQGSFEELETRSNKSDTPRKRGLKKGLFIFLLTFLIVPIISIITVAVRAEPFVVVIVSILFGVGGLLRMAYALLFESNEGANSESGENLLEKAQNLIGKKKNEQYLPPAQSIPAESFVPPMQGNWRDTNDLAQPSVTEETTKLLQKDI